MLSLFVASCTSFTAPLSAQPLITPMVTRACHEAVCMSIDAKELLLTMASRRVKEEEKEALMSEIMSSPAEDRESILDEAIAVIESSKSSLLGRVRLPVPLPSRRAALGSYGRLLDSMLSEEPGSGARFADEAGRRRRFLGVLLRQLKANSGGVRKLEATARQRRLAAASMEEMLRRTPDLETPAYDVVDSRPSWEVRKYAEFSVAATGRDRAVVSDGVAIQQPKMGGAGGFQALAGYILGGRNQAEEKMAMTTPVLSSSAKGEMAFVLPSRYWQPEVEAPLPTDSGVTIARKGGGALAASDSLAVLWFGGFAGAEEVARRKAELMAAVEEDPEWTAADQTDLESSLVLFQYNDPFTPPWNRRNEVALPVVRRAAVAP